MKACRGFSSRSERGATFSNINTHKRKHTQGAELGRDVKDAMSHRRLWSHQCARQQPISAYTATGALTTEKEHSLSLPLSLFVNKNKMNDRRGTRWGVPKRSPHIYGRRRRVHRTAAKHAHGQRGHPPLSRFFDSGATRGPESTGMSR